MTLIPNKTIDSCSCDTCNEGCCDELTKYDVGLGNVDNTSDADKPISTATQSALNGKADVTTVNNLLNRINTLEGYDFGDIRNRVIVLEGQVSTIQGAITTIQGDLQTVQTAIANNNIAVSNLTTLVQTYNNRITALENAITSIQGSINTLSGNYTNLEARVTNIEGHYVTTDTIQAISGEKYVNGGMRLLTGTFSDPLVRLHQNGGGFSYLAATNNNRTYVMTFDNSDNIRIPTPPGNNAYAVTNIAYVSDTSGTVNNLLHTNGVEYKSGILVFDAGSYPLSPFVRGIQNSNLNNQYRTVMKLGTTGSDGTVRQFSGILSTRGGVSMFYIRVHYVNGAWVIYENQHNDLISNRGSMQCTMGICTKDGEDYLYMYGVGAHAERGNIILYSNWKDTAIENPIYVSGDTVDLSQVTAYTDIVTMGI